MFKSFSGLTTAIRTLRNILPWVIVFADILKFADDRIKAAENGKPKDETPHGVGGPA